MTDEARYTRNEFFRAVVSRTAGFVDDMLRNTAETVQAAAASKSLKRGRNGETSPNFLRPPGAILEQDFLSKCTRCDDCVKACPPWALRKAGPELGENISGTPILIPKENPCKLCPDLPCIEACETGALIRPTGPVRMGTAVVDAASCYLAQGQPCDYCMKICPTRPKAITLGERGTPPAVDAEACTGCGECAQICPADAVRIAPRSREAAS